MLETPDGFLVSFTAERSELNHKEAGKVISKNIGTILVNKGIYNASHYNIWVPDQVTFITRWQLVCQ